MSLRSIADRLSLAIVDIDYTPQRSLTTESTTRYVQLFFALCLNVVFVAGWAIEGVTGITGVCRRSKIEEAEWYRKALALST